MAKTVLAFDLAYRKTGWAVVSYEPSDERWSILAHGTVQGQPKSASPVTERVRIQWADTCLEGLTEVIEEWACAEAIVYESPQQWLLAKARSQKYKPMRTKTSKEAILGFGAARERLYQAIAKSCNSQGRTVPPIFAMDPRRWQHVLDKAVLGDVTRLDRKAQVKRAVQMLTGLDLKAANADEIDAIGIGMWGARALALGELEEAA